MEEKKTTELSPEELDRVTGGVHDREEARRYELGEMRCPHCGKACRDEQELDAHIREKHPSDLT